jgi:hypothetical protein
MIAEFLKGHPMSNARRGRRKGKGPPSTPPLKESAGKGRPPSDQGQTTARILPVGGRPSIGRVLAVLGILALASVAFLSIKTLVLSQPGSLSIAYPFDGSLFPPEISAPTIWWEDGDSDARKWHVAIEFEGEYDRIDVDVDTTFWVPDRDLWESIKAQTLGTNASITVSSLVSFAGVQRTLSSQTVSISTSPDSVGAPIFFRDVPLPFLFANLNLTTIKWRLGNIGSYETPPVILSDLPVCGNCHSFSTDGKTLGMDVDVANDKGAYILTDFEPETIFSREKIFSWYDYYREGEYFRPPGQNISRRTVRRRGDER